MGKLVNELFELDMIGLMIEEKLGDLIKLYPLATVKNMEAKAGATINVPVTQYIGDAEDYDAGAPIDLKKLTQTNSTCEVKKAGKGISFTQEDINNAYINVQEEAEKQLVKAIASKVEKDLFAELDKGTANVTIPNIDVENLPDAVVPFGEDIEDAMYLFVHPANLADLRKDPDFVINANHGGKVIGTAGMIFGMEVIVTNRVVENTAYIVKEGALALFLKKAVEVEMDKDIVKQTYNVVATQHYVAKLVDTTKTVKLTIGAGA